MWRVSGTPVLAYDEFAKTLRLPHQLQRRREPQAALAGECNGLEFRALTIAGAGKPDADLVAAKHRILALRRRVLLVDDFAPSSDRSRSCRSRDNKRRRRRREC